MTSKRSTRSSASAFAAPTCPPTSSAPISPSSLREHSIPLASLNPYITCPLCGGYFVDATTITDCLHTFCKSCLLNYFEDNNDCPKCHFMIHQSHPSHYVSFDRTMQDIVYKLVPRMQLEEQKMRGQFGQENVEESRGSNGTTMAQEDRNASSDNGGDGRHCLPDSHLAEDTYRRRRHSKQHLDPSRNANGGQEQCCSGKNHSKEHRRSDDCVFIHLVPGSGLSAMERQFVRLSTFATVNTVKRLLAYMLHDGDITKYGNYDVYCRDELMGRDYSMAFIHKTRWRDRPLDEPLTLIYKEHVEF